MIIRPFNAAHLLLLALAAGAVVLLWVLLRGQPERCRSAVLIALCAANIIGFFVYKGFLSRDMQFLQVSGLDRFNWFSELPMQLCNINMFLIPIGILTKRRSSAGSFPHGIAAATGRAPRYKMQQPDANASGCLHFGRKKTAADADSAAVRGAGYGNRTRLSCLGSRCSTNELIPQVQLL